MKLQGCHHINFCIDAIDITDEQEQELRSLREAGIPGRYEDTIMVAVQSTEAYDVIEAWLKKNDIPYTEEEI